MGFASLAVDEPPLFITTSSDDDLNLPNVMTDVFASITSLCHYSQGPETFTMLQAPGYQADARDSPGARDIIALWPFKLDG